MANGVKDANSPILKFTESPFSYRWILDDWSLIEANFTIFNDDYSLQNSSIIWRIRGVNIVGEGQWSELQIIDFSKQKSRNVLLVSQVITKERYAI